MNGIERDRDERRPRRRDTTGQHGAFRGARALEIGIDEALQPAAHLLIAEDNPDMLQFLVESFEDEGYRVTEAENGDQLRRRLSGWIGTRGTTGPDILVSDICLPGMTGLELLADLRRSDWSLPVILITAFGDESVHEEGQRLGAALVLDKPFEIEDLVAAVKSLVPAR